MPNSWRHRKPSGRPAIRSIDEALHSILHTKDQQIAARLNNAAAMFILYLYSADPAAFPEDSSIAYGAEELAYQAANLQPTYCPALLNLTLFNAMEQPSSYDVVTPPGALITWTKYYPPEDCKDPALLYYRAQNSIAEVHRFSVRGRLGSGINTRSGGDPSETLKLTESLVGSRVGRAGAQRARGCLLLARRLLTRTG